MAVTSSGTATVTLPTDEQILITREFDAPKHLVLEGVHRRRSWSSAGGTRSAARSTVAEIDLRVGGKWRYAMVTDAGSRSASTASTVRSSRTSGSSRPRSTKGVPAESSEEDATTVTPRRSPRRTAGRRSRSSCRRASKESPGRDHRVRDGGRSAGRDRPARGGRRLARLSRTRRSPGALRPVARLAVDRQTWRGGRRAAAGPGRDERLDEERAYVIFRSPHEAAELLLGGTALRGLLLEGAERPRSPCASITLSTASAPSDGSARPRGPRRRRRSRAPPWRCG